MLVIVAIIGAILIGALLIYGILVTPARQPYRDALTQYENVNRANDAVNAAAASLNASTATDEQFKKNVEAAQTALASLKTENDALAKQEALKDGEGKEAYKVFDAKLKEYIAYNQNVLDSMLKVRPVLFECNQKGTNISEDEASVSGIRTCAANLGSIENVTNSDYKNLATDLKEGYGSVANILAQIVALPDPEGADKARHDELVNELSQATDELSVSSTEFTKSIQQHRNQVLPVNASKPLESYLNDKSRIF